MNTTEVIYLLIAILIWIAGYFHTGRFVRPKWKIPGKFLFYVGVSFALIKGVGPWAFLFIIGHPLIGFIFHMRVCRKHGINWLSCEPREKYLALQEKWAKGEFSKTDPDAG